MLSGPSTIYRADLGDENVAIWGSCNYSYFFQFPGVVCLPRGTSVAGLEAVPGKRYSHAAGNNATVLWVLTNSDLNGTALVAYDGYNPVAPVLATIPLPPTGDNATVTLVPGGASGFAIRNSAIHLLYTDGTLRRLQLDPATGLPVASGSPPALGFNMTAIALAANLTNRQGEQPLR